MDDVALALALSAPFAAAIVVAATWRNAAGGARSGAWVVGVGLAAAATTGVFASIGGWEPSAGPFTGDPLGLMMLNLVLGLSWLIQLYALRYLRGDARQAWFAVWTNLLTGSTAVMVCAGSVAWFAVGWVAAGFALVMLLATYAHLPQARQGVRRAGLSFAAGDIPLVLASAALVILAGGDVGWSELGATAERLPQPALWVLASAFVVAALARSAQLPFHRWLPATLSTPTPVSALLHAGVVNAGAIVLTRFAPLVGQVAVAMLIVFAFGAATLVYATALRLVKPDVKGRLVASTAGQMGYMMMAVGLGAFAAAVFHLIAHALFKSALFLGAGAGVRREAHQRSWPAPTRPTRAQSVLAIVVAVVVPVAALQAAKSLFAPEVSPASIALLGFVALTAGVALAAGLRRRLSGATLVLGLSGIITLLFLYVWFVNRFTAELSPDFVIETAPPWLLAIPALLLLSMEFIARSPDRARSLQRGLYAWALAESTVPPAPATPSNIPTRKERVLS